jgi:ferredoxin
MWEAKVEGASEKTLPKISLFRFLSLSSTMLASTSAPAHQQQRCCLPHSHSNSRRRHRTTRIAADKFCRDVVSTPRDKPVDDGSESSVTFVGAGGKEIAIQCKKSEYILDAGLEAGLELPYTCRAGICGACVGKVVAGEVDQSDVREFQVFFLVSAGVDETKPIFAHVSLSLSCYPIETSTLCRLQIDDISFTLEEQEVAAVSWFRARREREREREREKKKKVFDLAGRRRRRYLRNPLPTPSPPSKNSKKTPPRPPPKKTKTGHGPHLHEQARLRRGQARDAVRLRLLPGDRGVGGSDGLDRGRGAQHHHGPSQQRSVRVKGCCFLLLLLLLFLLLLLLIFLLLLLLLLDSFFLVSCFVFTRGNSLSFFV